MILSTQKDLELTCSHERERVNFLYGCSKWGVYSSKLERKKWSLQLSDEMQMYFSILKTVKEKEEV